MDLSNVPDRTSNGTGREYHSGLPVASCVIFSYKVESYKVIR